MKGSIEHFTIVIDREVLWKYFTYYKLKHPKARTFPFCTKITEKLYNKDGSPQLTKRKKHKTKIRKRKLSEIDKSNMFYSVLSLNNLLPINSMNYATQKKQWGELGSFLAKINKLEGKDYKNVVIEYRVFSETKANKDIDNLIGASKLLNDKLLVGSGMLADDNYTLLNPFIGSADYDKEHPRTEIRFSVVDESVREIYDKMRIHIKNFNFEGE